MAIYFFDKNQTLIKIVPESATFEAIQTQELDDDSLLKDTLSVTVKGDEKLLNAEYMAVKSYTGNAQTFDMYRIVTDTTPDKSMSFTGMSVAPYELNGHILQDLRPANHSLSYTLNRVLDGTDWRVGYIEDGLSNVTTTFYYVSAKEALKELQSLVGCEFVFKVEISGQKITDKWVEVYNEMGNRTKKRFNYGTNALTVVRETNKTDIYTALIGRGKGEEVSSAEDNESGQAGYGRKITFEDIEWSTANGNPLNKPIGQYYLELPQATQVYGIKNIDGTMSARVGIVDFEDEEDKNRVINLTYQQLLVSSRPKVLFKTTVANIGATAIGDTVTIHRHDLNIHYQTRVRKIVRNKLNDNKTQIELGDAVVTASTKQTKQNNATIKNLNQEIEKIKADVTISQTSADGKNTISYGSAEPERKRTGDTWYRPHPSIAGETQMLVWNGDAWELVIDTSDLTSVSREVKDVADKADEAVQAAKDANDLADKLAEDFDKLDISGVNLVLGSDTPKVLNDGETKYFWNLENPLSDYALKSGDKLTVSMYAELFSESEKFKNWSDSYYQFMEHNTKTTGNLAINDLGLVGGAFVPDNPLWSYTPPTTGTSEAQLLTIRGVLQQYLATNEKKWLDTAHFLTDGLLNYYYPTPSIPSTPDSSWIPHWLVNVNAPFKSRRWATDGEVNFVNGVGKANIPAIFRVWSARTADSTLEYLWAPDSPVIGTELEIESTDLKYKEDTGTIVLKDKTFTGKALLVYTSWDGEIINVGDKCEAYPVWRPLEEGEIACAVDALPWALDVFQLWYEATGDEVWLQAVESTKASIVSASNVSNTEYFIKPGANGEKVLKDGITVFSTRSPKETYTNENGMIMIDYPQSSGEASLGTWVGDSRALNSKSWIEVKVGSDKKEKIQIVIDEFADYDPDKRWIADILLSGEGLTEDKHQYISLTNKDFYKADRVVWGSAYDKTTNVSAVASGNSSLTTKTDPTQLKNNHPVTQLNFKRGDEGGWLGWAQAMLGIWNYTFPFNMNYKTNDNLYFVVNDSEGVRWEYILPKTGEAFKTININADLFTSTDGGKLSTENYQSMVIEAIDEEALLYIDYIGFVDYFNGSNFSNVSLTYKQPSALKLALSYIKPAPSRNPLDYTPYIMPFDYHYINYQLSDMRGAIYSGYQVPWIYQENVFKEADTALATNLRFLSDAQDAYQSAIGVDGFFTPIYWWNYRTDYGQNEPNSWGISGNWGSVWGGFQYRTISDVARVFRKAPNNKPAYDIFMRFLKGMDANWTSTVDGFPTAFVEDKAPYTDQKDSHMVSNFMRALLYGWESSRLTAADKTLIQKLLNKCYEYLDTLFNPIERFNNPVEGTWSPSPELDTWFNYWGGDILDGLAIARTSTAFNFGGETGQYSGALSLNTQNPNISLNTEPIKITNMEYGKKYRFNSTITLNGNDVAVRFDKPKLGITLSNTSKPFSLVVNKIKVEAGSKPTAHTLALSETVDVMAFSRFEKTLNGFRTTVRNMKSDKTTVTQLANLWRTTTELVDGHTSQITSMGTDISLRVSKGELLSQINIEAGNVLIESGTNKLNITPETTYIQDATIKSAMIASLEADKITTGTLDAGKVKVVNLDANNITANKTSFIQSNWNDINSTISIDGNGMRSVNSIGDWTLYHAGAISFGNSLSQGIYLEYADGARNGLAINNRGALNENITLDLVSSARNTLNFGRRTDTNGYDFRIDHYQGTKVSFDGRGVSRYTFNVNSDAQSHAISILGHGATSGYNDGSGLSIGLETADGRAKGSRFYFSSNSDLVWLGKDSYGDLKPLAVSDLQFRWGTNGRKSLKDVLEYLSRASGVDINNIPDVY